MGFPRLFQERHEGQEEREVGPLFSGIDPGM